MKLMWKAALPLTLGLISISTTSEAAQISQTFSLFLEGDFSINRFDSTLGTLTGVSANADFGGFLILTASGGVPGGSYFLAGNVEAAIQTDSPLAITTFGPLLLFGNLDANGSLPFFFGYDVTSSGAYTAGAADLSAFTGSTPITATFSNNSQFNASAPVNAGLLFPTGTLTVTYDYTEARAVAEPASWVMMIAGFGGMGGALRRRSVRYLRRPTP